MRFGRVSGLNRPNNAGEQGLDICSGQKVANMSTGTKLVTANSKSFGLRAVVRKEDNKQM